MEKHYLTPEGKKQLEEKLNYYKTVKRPNVVKRIGIAREFGDLSENSEYDAAKDEQAQIESEITEMENILLNAEVIDKKNIDSTVVNIGTKVKLYDEDFDEELEYRISGSSESDPKNGVISNVSPVAKAIIGHKKGESVVVHTPGGVSHFKIVDIKI
ncbi:MAG TPA: transcription elongation factor GreA [Candidatus Caccovivens faecavium]|nr:transcription elongation factor GreA [Candidatus Caccovivens faecavium]